MKLKTHFIVQFVVFIVLLFVLDLRSAIIVTLFHFIPSLDFVMYKINFFRELHRQLFHNIFVLIIALFILYIFGIESILLILCAFNFMLHMVMDFSEGGIMFFYPVSKYKLKSEFLSKIK